MRVKTKIYIGRRRRTKLLWGSKSKMKMWDRGIVGKECHMGKKERKRGRWVMGF